MVTASDSTRTSPARRMQRVEQRGVDRLDAADDRNVLVRPGARGPQEAASREDRHEGQGQHQGRRHGRHHRGGEGPVHAALDAAHGEERQEHGDDDQGREGDRPAHLERRGEHLPAPLPSLPRRQAVEDVLGQDDRRVHQQAHGDGEPAEGHGVEADPGRLQDQPREGDGERQREGHDQRRPQVAQQEEEHGHHQHGAQQDGPAHAAEGGATPARPGRRGCARRTPLAAGSARGPASAAARRGRPRRYRRRTAWTSGSSTISEPSPWAMPRRTAGRLADLGHLAEQHRRAVADRDDRAAQVADRSRRGPRRAPSTRSAPGRRSRPAAFSFDLLHRVHHLAQGHRQGRHAFRIELHLELAQVPAEHLDRRHAGHAEQAVPHLVIPRGRAAP